MCKPLPQDIGVGAGGSTPGTSLPQAMQGLGLWNGQNRQAPACLTPKHRAALPVRHLRLIFKLGWGKGQHLGGATATSSLFLQRLWRPPCFQKLRLASNCSQAEPWGR